MFDLHEWAKKPYPEPKQEVLRVDTPKFWFGEGTGTELKTLPVKIEGIAKVSYYSPPLRYATVLEIEYGTAIYKESTFTVIAPFAGHTEHWRYLGSLPSHYTDQFK